LSIDREAGDATLRGRRPGHIAKPMVLIYNDTYVSIPAHISNCPVDHTIVFDRSYFRDADAVIFHIPTLDGDFRLRKRPGQRWVALSAESEIVCLRMRDKQFMRQFDYTMTYRLDSDFSMTYVWPEMVDRLLAPPWVREKSDHAVCFISGKFNLSFRDEYVKELMRYMPVHSYGKVLRNRTLHQDTGRVTKLETIARYRFTLAFENSVADDYVSEKFFDPLLVGSVPVYLGATSVERFSPADHCYINVSDFSSPRRLADYLAWLTNNPDAYGEYLAWKERPLRPEFIRLAMQQRIHPVGRLCMALAGYRLPTSSSTL
jgi:hypothetical protein